MPYSGQSRSLWPRCSSWLGEAHPLLLCHLINWPKWLNLISVVLSQTPGMKSGKSMSISSVLFSLATFIALVNAAVTRQIEVVEVTIYMFLFFSTILFSLSRHSMLANYFLWMLILASNYFYTWFWWKGIDVLPRSTCGDEYTFLFAKVSIFHWFRSVMKAISLLIGIISSFYLPNMISCE
jgi:hypothetical protein